MNELSLNSIKTTEVSLVLPENLDISEYADIGLQLSRANKSMQFLIGDFMLYGERYGDQFSQVVSDLGFAPETIRNAIYVALKWPENKRNPNVSYTSHQITASLPKYMRFKSIQEAETGDLSSREVKVIKQAYRAATEGLDEAVLDDILAKAEDFHDSTFEVIRTINTLRELEGMDDSEEVENVKVCPACGYELD